MAPVPGPRDGPVAVTRPDVGSALHVADGAVLDSGPGDAVTVGPGDGTGVEHAAENATRATPSTRYRGRPRLIMYGT
ncbi:hypothetical protein [Tsukamurella spumae]|uniref:Uncharacterized protein n=1 Tax=Tsukamurella spumae TaxID=44753 RepID=A0A846WZB9_9ACTN|nr:hypothetical protein [Tsukamurella spumae]NKY18617.1 hypothetical protein [Tsukamurella spumae]